MDTGGGQELASLWVSLNTSTGYRSRDMHYCDQRQASGTGKSKNKSISGLCYVLGNVEVLSHAFIPTPSSPAQAVFSPSYSISFPSTRKRSYTASLKAFLANSSPRRGLGPADIFLSIHSLLNHTIYVESNFPFTLVYDSQGRPCEGIQCQRKLSPMKN